MKYLLIFLISTSVNAGLFGPKYKCEIHYKDEKFGEMTSDAIGLMAFDRAYTWLIGVEKEYPGDSKKTEVKCNISQDQIDYIKDQYKHKFKLHNIKAKVSKL